ncbi:MAG: sulfite exporter TauE/SafE family protein [Candidatus Paceibacterota bacterium]|jgi:sulfite exporter TauE/SafE/copper chaperone CopZ
MQKNIYHIQGMHCRSCELILEEKIGAISGITQVRVNHRRGTAEVYAKHEPNRREIEQAIKEAGYILGVPKKLDWITKDPMDYIELVLVYSLLFLLYAITKIAGLGDINISASASPSYLIVLLIGLTAGVSTCMAIVGGLVLSFATRHAERHPEATNWQKFRPHLFFNFGRIVSYGLLGGIIGAAGSLFRISNSFLGVITFIVGIILLYLGFKLIEIFPRWSQLSLTLPKGIARLFGLKQEIKEYSHLQSFIGGGLTFFLPCGFTQAMQVYAISTGSFTRGALIMFLFALGTAPGLLGIGGITSAAKGTFKRYFFKLAGVLVILFGVINISNAGALLGVNLKNTNREIEKPPAIVETVKGVQSVKMEQYGGGYKPNSFTVKKDIPVRWEINSTNSYTCAAFINVPELGIAETLKPGINVINFTPRKIGELRFSCSMGMYRGVFNVVE